MKATRLHLVHFRSARDLYIELDPRLTLLVGINGAGKSTILDSMAILLSWAAARLRSANSSGRKILDKDIHNEKTFSWLDLTCQTERLDRKEVFWRLLQTRKGRNPDIDPNDPLRGMTSLTALNEWAYKTRDRIGQNNGENNIPLFVYYPVHRAVIDIPLRIRTAHDFDLLDAYENAFTGGANFRHFFEWYRNREDIENQQLRESRKFIEDTQLHAVRSAIEKFMPEFSKIAVKRNPLRMEVHKNKEKLRVDQLSDGEKCLFAMVGDLARRLAIANPKRDKPLEGEGIVLIDEIDLHLHPEWQRMVISKLTETFPNCQFIISTHSPQVFGEVEAKCIRKLSIEIAFGLFSTTPNQALGLDSSEVLEEHMDAKSRNVDVSNKLSEIFCTIDNEKFSKAQKQIEKLEKELGGSIPEIVRAKSLITMLEPVKKKSTKGARK